jgi:hypothetical protein
MATKKRRKRSKRYFTNITEIAICAYNNTEDQRLRNKIYERFIEYPFDKLAENAIKTFKTKYFNDSFADVKANVVAFLNEKIHKYDKESGKAFSYFTVISRNYLWNENNKNYDVMKSRTDLESVDIARDVVNEVYSDNSKEYKSEFLDLFVKYVDTNLHKLFDKDRDRAIADSVNELFKRRHNLYSYNKKALYILIRERTNVNTQYITRVINSMKKLYTELYIEYNRNGFIKTKIDG